MGVVTMAGGALLMVVGGNGVVEQWSQQAEELAGCPAEAVVGQPAAALVTRVAVGARDAGRAGSAEVLVPGADRQAIGDLRLMPMPRPDGSVAWAVFQTAGERVTFTDVQAAAQAWSEVEKSRPPAHAQPVPVPDRADPRCGGHLPGSGRCPGTRLR